MSADPRSVQARAAGVFYLLTIITGVFAEVFVRGELMVRNDPAATAANILAHEQLYRLGLVADLIMLSCYIAVTVLLYLLFKPVRAGLALSGAFFSLVGIAVLAVNSLTHVAPLFFLGRDQLQALVLSSLKLHTAGYNIAGVFFGTYCVIIGYLIFKSGFLPRWLGVLMAIGGLSYSISGFAAFLLPGARFSDLTVLGGIAELSLTLWLIVMGTSWKTSSNST